MSLRVLLLGTPLDARTRLDGSRRAIVDLARGLVETQVARPTILVRPGAIVPAGCDALTVRGGPLEIFAAAARGRFDVVHAIFAPRMRTALALAALRRWTGVKVVQTLASVGLPRRVFSPIRAPIASRIDGSVDVLVATSQARLRELEGRGARAIYLPMPFAADELAEVKLPEGAHGGTAPSLLFVGDYELGGALEPTLEAFATMASPLGVRPTLLVAARTKTPESARIARRLEKIAGVRVLGELPSLLPWIAASRAVLLPATDTRAKLDHPRALLEAIALGTRIVVGPAPSLAELVSDPSLGEVTREVASLRAAMEHALIAEPVRPMARMALLELRRPTVVALRYGEVYRGLV